jgi:hypothetical protein
MLYRYCSWADVILSGHLAEDEYRKYQLLCRSCDLMKERMNCAASFQVKMDRLHELRSERQFKINNLISTYSALFPLKDIAGIESEEVFFSFLVFLSLSLFLLVFVSVPPNSAT